MLATDELPDIEPELADLFDRAPVSPLAETDKRVLNLGLKSRGIALLSDQVEGTVYTHGRHLAMMAEPVALKNAPSHVLQLIHGSLPYSEACLRLYGDAGQLLVVEVVEGPDLTPFNEAIWIKRTFAVQSPGTRTAGPTGTVRSWTR